jgi:hypothetical protein
VGSAIADEKYLDINVIKRSRTVHIAQWCRVRNEHIVATAKIVIERP